MFSAKILADSYYEGSRLTTMELTYPRCIHAEFMTHRMFSRNSASSRAIPVEKMLKNIQENPFIPIHWGKNQKGMQAEVELTEHEQMTARNWWLQGRDDALITANMLLKIGLHKQIVNRVVEPWMWITVIATGNSIAWENFFKLRCDSQAEPHIQKIAYMAREVFDGYEANVLIAGQWHLPLISDNDRHSLFIENQVKVSVGRCARVSYLTHDGRRAPEEDIALHDRLASSGHWSPFEHVAQAAPSSSLLCPELSGNFGPPWLQYRKQFAGEVCVRAPRNA